MRIRLVAVRAVGKRNRLFEITVQVASSASNRRVLALEWIFRFGVVEYKRRQQLLPASRRVAFFASLFEGTLVWIDVARGAGVKLHVFVTRRATRHVRLVTFFAGHLDMQSGQGIPRFRVIKLLGRFPVREIVATLAVIAELALVRIFVAGHAILREPKKGF